VIRETAAAPGFTLVEMLIATTIMLTITGAVFQLMNPAQDTYRAQPEAADVQQRLRVSVDVLSKDLLMAGGGTYAGPAAGSLRSYFASVLPYRIGEVNSDPGAGVFYRGDAISLLYVPSTPAQTTIRDDLPTLSSPLTLEAQANCPEPKAGQLCGFTAGTRAMLFDSSGASDAVTITAVQDAALQLEYDRPVSVAYGRGTAITEVSMHTYYLKTDKGTGVSQLMHYDGAGSDLPVVDNVVALAFEYFGDPQPPALIPDKPLSDAIGPWTTYGPKPPDLAVPGPFGWPPGENCTFIVDGGQHMPRLPTLAAGTGQVRLTPGMLTDGPWCPGGASPGRFDADLLRVRRVRVTVRIEAASDALRGRGSLFMRPGTAVTAGRYVPDQTIRFDILPRNLNLDR
jgi:hypothetical protein